jgi:alpha-1,2-mannosyltransferase
MLIVGAQAELIRPGRPGPSAEPRHRPPLLAAAAAGFAIALAAYIADLLGHPLHAMLPWFDLNVYKDAGLITRHSPSSLYSWKLQPGIRFTYTPFAALVFAGASMLPWPVLTWLMTVTSLAAVAAVGWLTFGALGWSGRRRAAAALCLGAAGLWTEPVQRALHLGQIEPLLMLLIVWDFCQSDRRWWKGAGIGLAAGIKLVPLIFIPYLVLTGKLRQAAAAAITFAVTTVVGFVFLPQASATWWLTGYFLHPGKVGGVDSLVNQSLLAMMTRAAGTLAAATPVWLAVSVVVGVLGLAAAALLHRSGRPVHGWAACALTSLLISPVSWDHHWVWIVPILAVLADLAVRARGRARWGYWAVTAILAVIFSAWPGSLSGPTAFVPEKGLLGIFSGPSGPGNNLRGGIDLRGFQPVSWNLFVLAGVILFALMLGAAWRVRREGGLAGGWLPERGLAQGILAGGMCRHGQAPRANLDVPGRDPALPECRDGHNGEREEDRRAAGDRDGRQGIV